MLKLGNFTWPNDPEQLRVSYSRSVKLDNTSDGLWSIADEGRFGRTFDGEGVFYGENAYKSISQLANFLYSGTAAAFVHPYWTQANVIMTRLQVTEECENRFLRYTFRLIETPA